MSESKPKAPESDSDYPKVPQKSEDLFRLLYNADLALMTAWDKEREEYVTLIVAVEELPADAKVDVIPIAVVLDPDTSVTRYTVPGSPEVVEK